MSTAPLFCRHGDAVDARTQWPALLSDNTIARTVSTTSSCGRGGPARVRMRMDLIVPPGSDTVGIGDAP
ncbi:hypothetical protein [Rhodococcus sp. NBC_00294]|uniref:hypothetical protein n=1 Tax=Rhodococcus sp. NBC_00294 TaxID=2976004 RepID=UPI002E2A73B7|nr:hypothetical protein [Rhodococcus sp. NBC_00294]